MAKGKSVNTEQAHKFFSVECFNNTWKYIDMKKRSSKENIEMISSSFASLWHWKKRKDCKPVNLSVAYWQLSRVFALAKDYNNAVMFGNLCLAASKGKSIEPFYLAYAYEALARAEMTGKNKKKMSSYKNISIKTAEKITNAEYKSWLINDLKSIK